MQNCLKSLAVFFSLLCASHATMCQERVLRFEKYGVENGLPNEQILDILEDRLGFIWLATIDGLVKFDGYSFKEYNYIREDNSSLPSPVVYQLMEDSKGGIWVVTEAGLCLYHRETDQFEVLLPRGHPAPPGNICRFFSKSDS